MFKTFPEFTKLTLKDRGEYEALVKNYPPIADVSFNILILWWGTLGQTAVSLLNDNLVVSYWVPGDEGQSGLSLIGTERVDESICSIFDHLREQGDKPRLVNAPDFVVNSMRYPELFLFKPGAGGDEYLVTMSKFAVLDTMPKHMRLRVRRFIRENGEHNVCVKDIDLGSFVNRQLLLEASERWPHRGVNYMSKFGRQLMPTIVANSVELGIKCIALYVGQELHAYLLYSTSSDKRYITLLSVRINYETPRIFEYVVHAFSRHLSEKGFVYANLYSDSESTTMRIVKIALKPDSFFKKYVIEPAKNA